MKNDITNKPINCLNYRDDVNYYFIRNILLNYISKEEISYREIGRISGCNAKILSNFTQKNYNIKFYNFCKIYDFIKTIEVGIHDEEFNYVTYVDYIDELRNELIEIISKKRLTILYLSNAIGIHPETLSSFFKKQRQISYTNFIKINKFLTSRNE